MLQNCFCNLLQGRVVKPKSRYKMSMWTLSLLWFFTFLYIIFGGICFHFMESDNEQLTRREFRQFKKQFLENYTCLNRAALNKFILKMETVFKQHIVSANGSEVSSNWDIPASVFFSTNVVTTIGYGMLAPSTDVGQVFCVFYAMFGIPLFLVAAGALVEKLIIISKNVTKSFARGCLQHKPRLLKIAGILVVASVGFVLFMVFPAVVFSMHEGWTFKETMFFIYTTLTTLGLSDIVPGEKLVENNWLYRLFIGGWILLGLVWMLFITGLFTDFFGIIIQRPSNTEDPSSGVRNEKSPILTKGSTYDVLSPD